MGETCFPGAFFRRGFHQLDPLVLKKIYETEVAPFTHATCTIISVALCFNPTQLKKTSRFSPTVSLKGRLARSEKQEGARKLHLHHKRS